MSTKPLAPKLFDPAILGPAFKGAFIKIDPRLLMRNPVIFVTEIVAPSSLFSWRPRHRLWRSVFRADRRLAVVHRTVRHLLEAVAEGRQGGADSLKRTNGPVTKTPLSNGNVIEMIPPPAQVGDIVRRCRPANSPGDGDVIEASPLSASAITGESAPVISPAATVGVTGGQVLSD